MTVSFVDASITFFDSMEFIDFDRVLRRHQCLATIPNCFLFEFFSYERRKEEEMSVKKILEPSSEAIPEMHGKLLLAILLVFLQTLAVSDSIESTDAKYIFPRGLIKFHRKRRKQWSSRPQTGKSSRWCDAIIYRARIGPKTFE